MEYNKNEAIRAKGIAEDMMEKKDFAGARKIALRAQHLFAGLDNISQLLTVCEVHCSAGAKVNEETDWYGILQVEPTAEESLIKKQYRKLALLLHPDKNKFPGAEAAFKLIREAHMTLSDQEKRSLHDIKRSTRITIPPRRSSQQMNQTSNVRKQSVNANNAPNTTARSNRRNQRQPTASTTQTFWTACMHCGMRYQYYKTILNRALRCHSCSKPYIAYDLSEQATPGANTAQYGFPSQDFPGQYAHNVGQHGNFGNTTNMGFQGDANGRTSAPDEAAGGSMDNGKADSARSANNSTEVRFAKVEVEPPKKEREVKPATENASQKRSRIMVVESSDSEITNGKTESSDVEEVNYTTGQNTGTAGRYPRRSVRQQQNVECNEEKSDADSDADADSSDNDDDYEVASSFVKPQVFKRLKKNRTSCDANQCGKTYSEGDVNAVKGQSNGTGMAVSDKDNNNHNTKHAHNMVPNESESLNNCINKETDGAMENEEILKAGTRSGVNFSSKSSPDLGAYSYPDPEFYDFDKDRGTDKFTVDQIWAVFDDLDGMPRFYARIRNVDAVNFKLRFNWLEHDPIGKAEMAWFDEDLPVSCGNFRSGKPDTTQDRMIFSHVVSCEKGTKRNTYKIHPRKGEVWALFKDWDIRWSSDADNHRTYQYEMVEVLSDYVEGSEINVIQLLKVKGFVSVFIQDPDSVNGTRKIPPDEILRFSHKVPSYRMSGNEREGILKGSLELDFASLPGNFGDIAPSISLDSTNLRVKKSFPIRVNDPGVADCFTDLSAKGTQEQANTCRDHHHTEYVNEVAILGHGQRSSKKDPATEARIHAGSQSMSHKHQVTEEMVIDARDSNAKAAAWEQHVRRSEPSSPIWCEYPASEFYSFEEERSSDKFQCGQIWALYSDVDKYPKYYCWIKKVEARKFEVLVKWLECCPSNKVEAQWTKQDLPIGCGRFELSKDEVTFDSTKIFSHLVRAVPVGTKEKYDIYPCIGEIWAVYRNWDVGWTRVDLENCEYDVVEIIEHTGSGLEVLLLEKVDGYRAVFKPARKDGILNSVEVLKAEYVRFSHQIPSFKLTQEWGGKLRGFWELDPASVPAGLLFAG
ncbi:hypothetical protein J5N97_017604 [Dioscorea zingiberensis]|uniref:J domain-containing protein n=1 Tax=Dioscorea zingiberensis TaxID=325984 RepID=A0A9D5CMR3_9LILI|nr:hypothetical protein J5N97_017604 [Dioscorea zingiberensis]